MKNSKGFGRFEILTVFVLMLALGAYLCCVALGGSSKQKFGAMEKSANSFLNTVKANTGSFGNLDVVYLDEVIKEGLLAKIKSPFSAHNCSVSESRVNLGSNPTVTLKCDNYLIENENFINNIKIYKVGKWQEEKPNGSNEKITLYNYLENGKEKYDEYYEDEYFLYRVNTDNNKRYQFVRNVENDYKVVSKVFYRTKVKIK